MADSLQFILIFFIITVEAFFQRVAISIPMAWFMKVKRFIFSILVHSLILNLAAVSPHVYTSLKQEVMDDHLKVPPPSGCVNIKRNMP